MKFSKKYLIIIIFIIIAGVILFLVNRRMTPVKEISVDKKIVQRTISASGNVRSRNEIDLSFANIGRIEKIYVEESKEVKKGDLLAAINNFTDYKTSQAYKDARDIALRDRDLFIMEYENDKNDAGGEQEYSIQLRKYNEQVSKAEASYQATLGTLSKSYIYAPINGYIIDIAKNEGETAGIAEKIFKLADINDLYFEIEVDQEDFGFLKLGQEVNVTFDSFENEKFKGIVSYLPKFTNSVSGSDFLVEIKFTEENKSKILLGMNGDAYIVLAKTDAAVDTVAFDEIYNDEEDKPYVFIIENNKIKKQYIELGLQGDIYTEIKSELPEKIIIPANPKDTLLEGRSVKIIK